MQQSHHGPHTARSRSRPAGLARRAGARIAATLALVAFVGACDTAEDVTPPMDVEVIQPAGPANIIIENGQGHFFFMPPIDQGEENGDFNPGLATDIQICEWDADAAEPCESVVESFETDEIAIDEDDELYQVNWKIKDTNAIENGTLYAIRVLASGVVLGSAEIVVGKNGREARQFANDLGGGVIPLTANQTLPIKYRIEYGIFCEGDCYEVAVTDQGGTFTTPGEDVGATFSPGSLPGGNEDVTLIIEEADLEPGEECLGDLAVLTTSGRCISFDTEPKLVNDFTGTVIVGICPDNGDVPPGVDPENFVIHHFDPDNQGLGVEALPGAATPFLDCSGYNTAMLDRGPFSRLAHAGLSAIRQLVGPAPLSARDEGFGGVTSRFSYFQWALPIVISSASSTSQTAIAGATVADPTVQVLTQHNHGSAPQVPAPNQDVTFEFFDVGGGSLGSITVQSGGGGYASVPWTLTNNVGTQTVVASAFNTPDVVFTAEAEQPLFSDSFENLSTAWTGTSSPSGSSNAWHRLDPSGIANAAVAAGYVSLPSGSSSDELPSAADGSNVSWFGNPSAGSATTGNYMGDPASQGPGSGGNSTAAQSGRFTSPVFGVPTPGSGETALLSFQSWWEIESVNPSGYDVMSVSVRDAGGTITALGSLNPASDPGGSSAIPLTSGGYNQAPVWTTVTVDISAFAGQQIQVLFDFNSRDTLYNGFRGWLVDDVQVVLSQTSSGASFGTIAADGSAGASSGGLNPVPAESVRQQ